jgi:tetratricopeptide (TPR) repeat protein
MRLFAVTAWLLAAAAAHPPAERALNEQDRVALEKIAAESSTAAASKPADFGVQLEAALHQSMLSQLAIELGDKQMGRRAAEAGMGPARKAIELRPSDAEAHRLLGTLCGQVIPANPLSALKYGRCAMDEVKKAIELNPKSAGAWLSRGVGNYYLPEAFGGGLRLAIQDIDKAIQLDGKNAEAYLWRGIAQRKAGNAAEARKALERSLSLNPQRKWTKQQLEKLPAR